MNLNEAAPADDDAEEAEIDSVARSFADQLGLQSVESSFETNPPIQPSLRLLRGFRERSLSVDEREDVRYLSLIHISEPTRPY